MGDWATWLILAGRGWGKTRTGAEGVRAWHRKHSPIALIGRTSSDVRDVMVEGPSGVLAVSPRWERPRYEPSKRRLTWPNGARGICYSAEEPDRLRGPQHAKAWGDEVAAWKYAREAWDNLQLGLRSGVHPQTIVTTTPKPKKLIRELARETEDVFLTTGASFENAANVDPGWLKRMKRVYGDTPLGLQELYAAILDEVPGALWSRASIEYHEPPMMRAPRDESRSPLATSKTLPDGSKGVFQPDLVRIVVAVDPNVSSSAHADEAGIVVCGLGSDAAGYVLEDMTVRGGPTVWAQRAVTAFHAWEADRIVPEVNNGGELVEMTIRAVDPDVPVKAVWASRGKRARAEPVAALYQQKPRRVWHVRPFEDLEDELVSYVPEAGSPSPNRMDALVWGMTELMLGGYDQGIGVGPDIWDQPI